MNAYHAHGFSRNMYQSLAELAPRATSPDMAHPEADTLYWACWLPGARLELAKLVDPQQLSDWFTSLPPMTKKELYCAIRRQVELEEAHLLADATCTCWDVPSGQSFTCPVCQAMADGQEIIF